MKKKYAFKTISAKKFFNKKKGIYEFPFEALDKTPGGSNLGRIEWHIEPVRGRKQQGRYYIEKIYVWASQTRDRRYARKVFEIPCFVEAITASALRDRASYLHYVWRLMFCEIHKTTVYSAYPGNEHSALRIPIDSSISCEPEFI